uniref:Cytochrome P450 monooxygeanse terP n=1 Tax=Tolypocladium album TaxID=124418 RepID=TERP_TOLAL|nr:cytochrome P450 monooxygenase [Tolypocladium album]
MPSLLLSLLLLQVPIICAWLLVRFIIDLTGKNGTIPTIRRWPALFPEFLDRLSYNDNAAQLVEEGYRKYKDRPFRLLKMDMDLVVIPLKYATELRAITSDKLDPLTASFDDNAGELTGILLGSELHSDAIHRRLTPGLRIPSTKYCRILTVCAFPERVGYLTDVIGNWTPVIPYELVLRLSTRAAARVFVGETICRDEVFLETCSSFSRNTFDTIATFRNLGKTIGFMLGILTPSVRKAREQGAYVQKLLGSEVERRRACPDEKHDDFLQWCIDLARTEQEAKPEALATRTIGILSMAVVHTTAMATTHMLFDLLADSKLRETLKKEQEDVLPSGWDGIDQNSMLKMRLLDSLMRESQRINPVGEFTFRRVVRKPITLSDGYQLRRGQQIAISARRINMDGATLEDAQTFCPSRWAQETQGASFSHSSSSNLHFGLGRYACPGRFFASYMIKAITSRILLEYDFKLESGREGYRPPNSIQGDKILPNRDAVVLFRRREVSI